MAALGTSAGAHEMSSITVLQTQQTDSGMQERKRRQEQQEAQEAWQQGQEPQEQTVARLTGKIMGRVVAADAAAHAWQAKVWAQQPGSTACAGDVPADSSRMQLVSSSHGLHCISARGGLSRLWGAAFMHLPASTAAKGM